MTKCINQAKSCFTDDTISKVIWRYSLPMFAAVVALLGYDLLESSLLAQNSLNTLTALGFTLPITISMTAIAIGTSIRCSNKAIKFACLNQPLLKQTISTALITSTMLIVSFAAVAAIFSQELLNVLGNQSWQVFPESQELTTLIQQQNDYLLVRFLSWGFLGLIWQCNAIFRALGEIRIASHLMVSWLVFKSILAIALLSPTSPLFQEGLAGLSFIHGITDTVFALISLGLLSQKVALRLPSLTAISHSIRQPKLDATIIVIQQLITPLSLAILTIIAAKIDSAYIAAFAILFRVEAVILLLPMILTTSMPAIIGTNYWSGYNERVKKAYRLIFTTIVIIQLCIALMVCYYSDFLARILCPQTGVLAHLENYFIWVPWGYAAAGCAIVYQSCLNAKGKTIQAIFIAIAHRIILLLPLTTFGSMMSPSKGLFQGMLLGHIGVGLLVLLMFKLSNKQSDNKPIPLSETNHENWQANA